MKDVASIQQQLEQIMDTSFAIVSLTDNSKPLLSEMFHKNRAVTSFIFEERIYFPYDDGSGDPVAFIVCEHQITGKERQLIAVLLAGLQRGGAVCYPQEPSEEERMKQFGRWLLQNTGGIEVGGLPPVGLKLTERLAKRMVPLLLQGDGLYASYAQLNKLLDSYLGDDVLLVPLEQKEWLVLACENAVFGTEEERDKDFPETVEEVLTAFALGLYELIASEWGGVFHVAVNRPFLPIEGVSGTLALLRETMYLGKLFHVAEHIHFPWELRLERLLYSIPDEQRQRFIQQDGIHSGMLGDVETLGTLTTFFQLDCNVSETAKRLYIHRNTLIYRLDKIKQETGLDVRTFNDAVVVRLILLLYKVTKS